MKQFRFMLLCTLAIYLFALFNSDSYGVNALEAKQKGVGKAVKCKEQVDEALRQYWDKDDGDKDGSDVHESTENNTNEDDDEDEDDESGEDKKVTSEEDDDDDSDSKEADTKDDQDDDDDDDDNDDDDEKDDSDESTEAKRKDDDDDEEDDDDDSPAENAAKVRAKKDASAKKVDDDDDDDDDDNHSEEDKKAENSTPLKGANAAPAVSKKEAKKESAKPKPSSKSTKAKSVEEAKDDDDDDEELSEEELAKQQHQQKRSRTHIDDILQVYEIGSQDDNLEQNLILSIFRDLKRIYEQTVKPLETIYKYRQITTRLITDAEIFSKPMVLFLGGKSTGKSSLVNYLLGIDDTPWEIKIGAASQTKFTILSYGENYTHLSPTELSADYTFSSLQRFGEQFINEYIDAHRLPINILQKMTIVDSPGLIDLLPAKTAKQTIDNDVYQWFIDRSDVIYIVIDVSQLHLSSSLRVLLDQLKGREVRFIISKSDIASHSQIISMIGQLLWVLSPIMSAEQPPMVYALTTMPQESFDEFLDVQESAWLKDLSYELSGISKLESHIAEIRRHAVRVRNHAKLVDCYLSTYYKNKGLFTFGASSRQLAVDISENPHQYRIYSGAFIGQLQNVSRYDLPDPGVYREFFRSNPLIDFKPLTSTCSYFRGCPIDKLDVAIAYDLPELVGKYKKLTKVKLDQN